VNSWVWIRHIYVVQIETWYYQQGEERTRINKSCLNICFSLTTYAFSYDHDQLFIFNGLVRSDQSREVLRGMIYTQTDDIITSQRSL